MFRQRLLILSLVLLASRSAVQAHDYWIQPDALQPRAGATVPIRLFVGDGFDPETERNYSKKMTVRFRMLSPDGMSNLMQADRNGKKPVAVITPQAAGTYLLAMQRDWSRIELKPEKFNQYLEHEGLQGILEQRKKSGEFDKVGNERYRRYLKSAVRVGQSADLHYGRRLGHRLEILPQSDPTLAQPGETVAFQVTFEGKPLRHVQLFALRRHQQKTTKQQQTTSAGGIAGFQITGPGTWMVRLVHMQRCTDEPGMDWESFWASYTFGIGPDAQAKRK
ncbi:MAG: DUF4198 domain-containing protein [Planctomycetaceae bacterium]